eukprot:m.238045 g.238045  ORF g.238045 m.238045 type:complete len:601 (+) comp13238_c0_seq1:2560-4362(+)
MNASVASVAHALDAVINCSLSGALWNRTSQSCVPPIVLRCPAVIVGPNFLESRCPQRTPGSMCLVNCTPGFGGVAPSASFRCDISVGDWVGNLSCDPNRCPAQEISSSVLTSPLGSAANKTQAPAASIGTVILFSCAPGYYGLAGPLSSTCLVNTTSPQSSGAGVWTPSVSGPNGPICRRNCELLQAPTNGYYEMNNFSSSSSTVLAAFTCNTGYQLRGSSSVFCLDSGQWSSIPPLCQAADCPPLASGTPCTCLAGTSSNISWIPQSGSYIGGCSQVPCPRGSIGANVVSGCVCTDFPGISIVPSQSAPYYINTCTRPGIVSNYSTFQQLSNATAVLYPGDIISGNSTYGSFAFRMGYQVNYLDITLRAADGGATTSAKRVPGGAGGLGTFRITRTSLPSATFYIYTGQYGLPSAGYDMPLFNAFNGGGSATDWDGTRGTYSTCGGGGGASDVRLVFSADPLNRTSLLSRIAIVGGGGGGSNGGMSAMCLGGGGGTFNASGTAQTCTYPGGKGGGLFAGGLYAGLLGIGGDGDLSSLSGGGGGGYFGGGSTSFHGGGGGGSGYLAAGLTAIMAINGTVGGGTNYTTSNPVHGSFVVAAY